MEADLDRRFSGLARLYGVAGASRIAAAHVVVVGIGGVGSWAAEALARSAVGQLTLIDLDHVAESNVNRQIHALTSTVGQAKVLAMQQRIAQINPQCRVRVVEEFVEPGNWPALVDGEGMAPPDAVIDACDQPSAKLALARWALDTRTRFITVGAAGGKRLAHQVDIADLAETTHDPLLASLRYRLRREHGAPRGGSRIGVNCVFSREAVQQADPSCLVPTGEGEGGSTASQDSSLNCHGYGSVVSVTATFGQCAAGWVLDQLARAEQRANPIQSKALPKRDPEAGIAAQEAVKDALKEMGR